MFCPTPPIAVGDVLDSRRKRRAALIKAAYLFHIGSRQKRQTSRTINDEKGIDVEIGFILDGIQTYENITTSLPEYSKLSVYANPVISGFEPPSFTRTFTPTWPVSDKYLEIKVSILELILGNEVHQ